MYAIDAFDLSKKYLPPGKLVSLIMRSPIKEGILAVDSVNLQIGEGELFGLIGPNGAGKTTLTKILCTLLWPTSGTASINGHDIKLDEENVKASIGFVSSEERSFYWRLTGRQNLEFFASLRGFHGAVAREKISAALKLLDLEEAADNMLYSYSSGMKQKLAVARGLINEPKVLFLDEPTKSIDPIAARDLKRFVKDELVNRRGMTVFLTSHRLEEIEELCDRFAIINGGRITFCGTVEDLRDGLGMNEHYRLCLRGFTRSNIIRLLAGNKLEDISFRDDGNTSMTLDFTFPQGVDRLPKLLADAVALGADVISCEKQEQKLEDMFIEHISREAVR